MSNLPHDLLKESLQAVQDLLNDEALLQKIDNSIDTLTNSLKSGGKIFSCGNGGSLCDAQHFAEELTGRFRKDRAPLPAISLADPAHMSCVANDFGFDFVFSRSITALGASPDCLLAISTSGNSANILEACKAAKEKGMTIIALTGKSGGILKDLADISIIVPPKKTERIQELHIKIVHILIEGIERNLFPELY